MLSTLAILAMLAVNLVPIGLQWLQQEQEARAVTAELQAAKNRVDDLQYQIDAWDNDNYVASQAKTRLGYVYPGEVQFNVTGLPEDIDVSDQSLVASPEAPARPWSSQILDSIILIDSPPASEALLPYQDGYEEPQSGADQGH